MSSVKQRSVLNTRDLCVGYKKQPILSGVNLSFDAGQFISLLGPNGAGKTTLLRTLSRHLAPLAGEVTVEGKALASLSALDLARTMAVVLTDKVSPPLFSVDEFVALGRYPHTDYLGRMTARDRQAVDGALAAVHATELAHRPFTDLSDGERQKVLVARALAQEPRILLLDEPTIHLDLRHRVEIMAILRDLCRNKGITVVASLHDVDVAAKVSDRVALIKNDAIVDWGLPETILTPETVAGLYDFDRAEFNRHLGGIELRGDGDRGLAFVVAGMGSGAMVYRMLAKKGFAIATGVVHTNDLDYFVAQSLGARCAACAPGEKVNGTAFTHAEELMAGADVVIDCGFAVGGMNRANLDLLDLALAQGKPVFTLRQGGLPDPAGKNGSRFIPCGDPLQLLNALEAFASRHTPTTAFPEA